MIANKLTEAERQKCATMNLADFGITYNRPGYTLDSAYCTARDCMRVTIRALRPDSTDVRARPVPIFSAITLHALELLDKEAVAARVRNLLLEFEKHEVDEWLRLDGALYVCPHPDQEGH